MSLVDADKAGKSFTCNQIQVTDVSNNRLQQSVFDWAQGVGAYWVSLYFPESNGRFMLIRITDFPEQPEAGYRAEVMELRILTELTHVAVVRLKADGSYEFWMIRHPKLPAFRTLNLPTQWTSNLNGYANATTGQLPE